MELGLGFVVEGEWSRDGSTRRVDEAAAVPAGSDGHRGRHPRVIRRAGVSQGLSPWCRPP